MEWLKPICWSGGSDSAGLDNALEAIERSGRDVLHAMMMLVPEAWEHMADMDAARRAFYEYHACLMEPWDGPRWRSATGGWWRRRSTATACARPARSPGTAWW